MTCLEKYLQIHPGVNPDDVYIGACPFWDGLTNLDKPEYCGKIDGDCEKCWNREIPGTEEPHIRDSGNRTVFPSGGVRDIQKGKGRCDLMPLDVIAECYDREFHNTVTGKIFSDIHAFTETGDYRHLCDALSRKEPFDSWSDMLLELAKHFEEGAEKYGENNWQKGLPAKCYINSAVRHYLKWLRGDKDEFHNRAFCWNIICAIWTCKHRPELNDYAPGKLGFNPDDFIGEYEEEND